MGEERYIERQQERKSSGMESKFGGDMAYGGWGEDLVSSASRK
jgi:hypothetical protein